MSPSLPGHSMAPKGPALAVISGKHLPCTPLLGKGHSRDHVLPAPSWRDSIQKNHPRVWESSPKAQPKPWSAVGVTDRGTAKPRCGHHPQGQAGTPRAVPFLVEHPRAHEMVAKQILSSRIHMTAGGDPSSWEALDNQALAHTPVPNVLTLPPPPPLQMLPVLSVFAQRAPGSHPAHPPSPSPPQ